MAHVENTSCCASQVEENQVPLIPGLPDDIAHFCLARVPRRYHAVLKCVSKKWRALVCSEEWYAYRRKHSLHETWIYALCRDKFDQLCCYFLDPLSPRRSWKRIRDLPPHILRRKGVGFEVLGKKLYLLGGSAWLEDATDEAHCYDVCTNSWTLGPHMSTQRCYFACEVLKEKIYAIGGSGLKASIPNSWDIYDPCTNSWESRKDPNVIPEIEDSFVMDGKIYIRCGQSSITSNVYAVVYEPFTGIWEHVDENLASGWRGPAVVLDGTLYVLDESSGTKLMMWQKDAKVWVPVGRLSLLLTRPPCQLVAIRKNIFIIGKGCSTVVIDVGKACGMEGVMMASSIPKLGSDDFVISCTCLAL